MSENTRSRGVVAYIMDDDEVTGPEAAYAVVFNESATEARMVHTEGVSYLVNNDKPWTWNDYSSDAKKFTFEELLAMTETADQIDLADWVRTFGARLESNFYQVYKWATK